MREAPISQTHPNRDAIILTGLRAQAHHGVYDFEREAGQPFVVDATVWLDLSRASSGDDLSSTLHYGELAAEIVASVESDPVDLIETVAERVARVVLGHEQAQAVEVTVHKPEAPIAVPFADVAVRIYRERATRSAPRPVIRPAGASAPAGTSAPAETSAPGAIDGHPASPEHGGTS
jgi:7,8-dihydroneopterin aldolase/epimerase/oxygenase